MLLFYVSVLEDSQRQTSNGVDGNSFEGKDEKDQAVCTSESRPFFLFAALNK